MATWKLIQLQTLSFWKTVWTNPPFQMVTWLHEKAPRTFAPSCSPLSTTCREHERSGAALIEVPSCKPRVPPDRTYSWGNSVLSWGRLISFSLRAVLPFADPNLWVASWTNLLWLRATRADYKVHVKNQNSLFSIFWASLLRCYL